MNRTTENQYCCDKFAEDAGRLLPASGGGFMYPGEIRPDAQFVCRNNIWYIHGCCGGGCFVVDEMKFCPYCGSELKDGGNKE